jgi:NAD(P)H-hydrate epimerase
VDQGAQVRVILAGTASRLRKEPATFARILSRLGCDLAEVDSPAHVPMIRRWLQDAVVVVDALLGIGAAGPVREPVAALIEAINAAGKPVVSADIPSGLNADTGKAQGPAVRAAVTVAFGLVKQGCLKAEGPALSGRIIVESITIPQRLLKP